MLEVYIPFEFNKETVYSFIDSVIYPDMTPKSPHITFEFSNMRFIEPSGVTILSNVIEWLKKRNVEINLSYSLGEKTGITTEGIKYLDDSMFFKHYLNRTLTKGASIRPTTMPIKQISYDESYSWIRNRFIPWLGTNLSSEQEVLSEIFTHSFGEIFNNIRDHSEEVIGCIFAQHYPNLNKIIISISDFGTGIPNTIRRRYPNLDDHEAIEKAIQEGVSSKSRPSNRGAGLRNLLDNVVINYGGTVQIISLSGSITVNPYNDSDFMVYSKKEDHKYPGTFIEITFDTNKISNLQSEEEEFVWDW